MDNKKYYLQYLHQKFSVLLVSVLFLISCDPLYKEGFANYQTGVASWYKTGKKDVDKLVAIHENLPLNSWVSVTNIENKKTTNVKIVDGGKPKKGRVINLSEAAAKVLDFHEKGLTAVSITYLGKNDDFIESGEIEEVEVVVTETSSVNKKMQHTKTVRPKIKPKIERSKVLESNTKKAEVNKKKSANKKGNPRGQFFVQIYAFDDLEEAVKTSIEVEEYYPNIIMDAVVNDKKYHRLRLGPIDSKKEALEVLKRMKSNGFPDSFLALP